MIESLATEWEDLPVQWSFLAAFLMHLAVYFTLAGGVMLACGASLRIFRHGKLLDTQPLKPHQIRGEISSSMITCGICAVYTVICLKLSHGVWPVSWLVAFFQVVLYSVFYDFYFYWTHRLLHARHLIAVHGTHHRSVRVTPWAIHSLHPVEAAINHLPAVLFVWVWPTGIVMIVLFHVIQTVAPAIGHSNFDPYPDRAWLRAIKAWTRFHQLHHMTGRGNFGFLGTHWDAVFGTTYRPKSAPN